MRHRYQQAVSVPLQVVRLRVDVSLARRRLRSRHAGDPAALNWHLHRAAELHDILQSVAAEDFVVDADDLTIEQAATAMIVRAGWGAATSSP